MSYARKIVAVAFAGGLLLTVAACGNTKNGLDNADNADVVLEITKVPPFQPVQTSGSLAAGTCTLTAPTAVTMSMKNVPKNALGTTSPYNDIIVDTVRIDYVWVGGVLSSLPLTIPAGVTVPANNGTGDVQIVPVAVADLNPVTTYAGQTAVVTITASGHAVEGRPVNAVYSGAIININPCQP